MELSETQPRRTHWHFTVKKLPRNARNSILKLNLTYACVNIAVHSGGGNPRECLQQSIHVGRTAAYIRRMLWIDGKKAPEESD